MNQEEYMDILNDKYVSMSQTSAEADLFEFLQSLYIVCLEKHQEKPTYTLFMECLIDAYVSTERLTEEAFRNIVHENEETFKTANEDFYTLLHFISTEEAFWHNYRISCFSENRSANWHHFDWNISYIFYGTIYDFLAKSKTKKLFTKKNVSWKDFIELIQLLIIPIDTVFLCSNSAEDTLNYLQKYDNLYVTDKTIGLYAWVAAKWRMVYLPWRYNIHDFDDFFNYKEFPTHFGFSRCQAFISYWREKSYNYGENPEKVRYEIYHRIHKILEKQLSKEKTSKILKAAQFFDMVYPEQYGIGNADGTFYDEDINLVHAFYPYREYFEDALPESDVLQYEWITATQVLWQYYRWTTNYIHYQKILEPLEYLFEKAVTLSPQDVHYMRFDGKVPLGAINFYYAEFLYYQKQDYDRALQYYEEFIKLEPKFLPNNLIELSSYLIDWLIYPISTQEALAQIAKIYLLKEDFEKAKTYVKKAIKLRSNNFQAPYEILAEIYQKQNQLELAIDALNDKIKAIEKSRITKSYSKPIPIVYYITYDPTQKESLSLHGGRYHHAKIHYIYDYYFKISELYNILGQSEKAEKALNDGNRLKKRIKIW